MEPDILSPERLPEPERSDALSSVDRSRPTSPWVWWCVGLSLSAVVASALQVGLGATEYGYFVITLCFVLCGIAAWLDVATRRIPNVLTYPAILIALVLNLGAPFLLEAMDARVAMVWLGTPGPLDCAMGFGVAAGIGIVSFLARGLGGGDVKLLAAVAALIGLRAFLPVFLNTIAVAALIGIVNWTVKGTLVPRIQIVAQNAFAAVVAGYSFRDVYPFGRTESPFALALLIGLILSPFLSILDLLTQVVS